MKQTDFQRLLWTVVTEAHAAGDRADARILLGMIEAIDAGDYASLPQMALALRQQYRTRIGKVPTSPTVHELGEG
ncbi:MAG: hypothetical protein JNN13_12975 [Planctomycetes bacterium]|nr:hypothetical protein [Planctomycetota bacterium]